MIRYVWTNTSQLNIIGNVTLFTIDVSFVGNDQIIRSENQNDILNCYALPGYGTADITLAEIERLK